MRNIRPFFKVPYMAIQSHLGSSPRSKYVGILYVAPIYDYIHTNINFIHYNFVSSYYQTIN